MNDTTMNNRVKVELVETNFFTRHACHCCGGHTEKVAILAEVRSGPHEGFRVCETCIETRDFEVKMLAYATTLERQAQELRGLVGRLDVPTHAEYLAADKAFERKCRKARGLPATEAFSDDAPF